PIPADGGLDVPLPPVLEPQVVDIAVLANAPAVEELVDDVDAQLVAGVQQRLGGRVVGGADGVVAAFPQLLDFAELRPGQRGRAQNAVVVVDAAAVELHLPAVDLHALGGGDLNLADADVL